MKNLIVTGLLFFISCNIPGKNENVTIKGAYKMLWQNVKSDDTDTTNRSLQQMKIYTDDYMMYASVTSDSIGGFGIGTYNSVKDTIIENVIYNASDSTENQNAGTYKLIIEKTEKGYKQIIPDIMIQGQKVRLTEEYESIGTTSTSPLDGAWKQIKAYSVNGKDTTVDKLTQFKIYHAGHIIWGQTYKDYKNKIHTAMGYGKFEMNNNNKLRESMSASTFYQVRGHDFDIDIEMKGNDDYTQTITNSDGSKSVEIYQRLKK